MGMALTESQTTGERRRVLKKKVSESSAKEAAKDLDTRSDATTSPPRSQDLASEDPHKDLQDDASGLLVVQKRLRKWQKKRESISQTAMRKAEGVSLNADQEALLAQEPQVSAVLEELVSLQAQLSAAESVEAPEAQVQKRLRKYNKKLLSVAELKKKQSEGVALNADQTNTLTKALETESGVEAVIAELTALLAQLVGKDDASQ